MQPGGGASDALRDYGGTTTGLRAGERSPSKDIYKGFADNTGTDEISDWGGTGDILDLRPISTHDVYIEVIGLDGNPANSESLQIVTGPPSQVVVVGQFGPYWSGNQQGRIEKLFFADTTITDITSLSQASAASREAVSAEARSGKQAELAEAAPRLADEARALIDPSDPTGVKAARGRGAPGAEIDTRQDQPAKTKKAKMAKKAKKRATHGKQEKRTKQDNNATSE